MSNSHNQRAAIAAYRERFPDASYTRALNAVRNGWRPTPPSDSSAGIAGLVARSKGQLTHEQFTARLKRGGEEYTAYLTAGHEAAIEALEYALKLGIDAVDDQLASVAADKGLPIGQPELAEALRHVREHTLVMDGSAVAETAYWVTDRYWMHRYNAASDSAPPGEFEKHARPAYHRRMALHEWMMPGYQDDLAIVPGLTGYRH